MPGGLRGVVGGGVGDGRGEAGDEQRLGDGGCIVGEGLVLGGEARAEFDGVLAGEPEVPDFLGEEGENGGAGADALGTGQGGVLGALAEAPAASA